MPTFVHPALLWGLPLAALPVLIHLINMMRHRRVPWAAMEFLLASQRKNRAWVLLKHLLLLLLRVAAVAMVVLMVAQPVLRSQFGGLLGGARTHHVVLLDDSYSMSDRWGPTSAFDEAKGVVERIGAEAAKQGQPQQLTLVRFSRGSKADLAAETVDRDFPVRLRETLGKMRPSETAVGPGEALEALDALLGPAADERRIVYLVSDFRARQWADPTELKKRLADLDRAGVRIHLIRCVEAAHPNLAITSLAPAPGTRAAGVPLFMEIAVRNFGASPAQGVSVLLEEDDHARPAARIAEIPPGQTVKERFLVNFPTAGQHRVTARLESDAVAADNARFAVVDLPADVPVLVVDGAPEAEDAHFLSAALAPGGGVRTGIQPRIETPRYLSLQPLEAFRAVYLADIDHLDRSAVEALEKYLAGGGGVAVFLGPRSESQRIDEELYRGGKGFFPLPLAGPSDLGTDQLATGPDLEVTDHPIFRVFAGQQNSFIATVLVDRYFAVPKEWHPPADSSARVIARLRNGAPLAVERPYGKGKVIVFLTTAAPVWNNWARGNPSFVVMVQELQAYLADRPAAGEDRRVGSPLKLYLDAGRYQPQVRFTAPGADAAATASIDAAPSPDGSQRVASLRETDASGVYEARLARTDGSREARAYAFNVDPAEGDLALTPAARLAAGLEGVRYQYTPAPAFQYDDRELGGFNLSEILLYLLIATLVAEQILAWSASYHPPARRRASGKGGAV